MEVLNQAGLWHDAEAANHLEQRRSDPRRGQTQGSIYIEKGKWRNQSSAIAHWKRSFLQDRKYEAFKKREKEAQARQRERVKKLETKQRVKRIARDIRQKRKPKAKQKSKSK